VGYDFVKEILEIEEVAECYNISGDFDFSESSGPGYETLSGFCIQ
jgi:hypothetical protein